MRIFQCNNCLKCFRNIKFLNMKYVFVSLGLCWFICWFSRAERYACFFYKKRIEYTVYIPIYLLKNGNFKWKSLFIYIRFLFTYTIFNLAMILFWFDFLLLLLICLCYFFLVFHGLCYIYCVCYLLGSKCVAIIPGLCSHASTYCTKKYVHHMIQTSL